MLTEVTCGFAAKMIGLPPVFMHEHGLGGGVIQVTCCRTDTRHRTALVPQITIQNTDKVKYKWLYRMGKMMRCYFL